MAIYDLTKQEVVEYLAEFEEKLPNMGIALYEKSYDFKSYDQQSVLFEAKRIIHFLAIDGYNVRIDYKNIIKEEGAAGQAHLGDLAKGEYHITLDPSICYNEYKTLKVLAHEICHLYLKQHFIFSDFEKIDESRAELCTIFMGLGLLTLRGYDETGGYLNLEDFCHAFCVVYRTRGLSDEMIKTIVPAKCIHYVETILNDMTELQKHSLGELVKSSQYSDYNFRRRMRILQLLLDNMQEIQEKHNLQDGVFRNKKAQLKENKPPIFEMLQRETFVQNSLSDDRLDKCTEEMDKLIDFICSTMKVDLEKVSEGLAQNVTCPSCGFVSKKYAANTLKVQTCSHCHHYFVWDGRPLELPMDKSNQESSLLDRLMSFGKKQFDR
jgi:hypothetical protein